MARVLRGAKRCLVKSKVALGNSVRKQRKLPSLLLFLSSSSSSSCGGRAKSSSSYLERIPRGRSQVRRGLEQVVQHRKSFFFVFFLFRPRSDGRSTLSLSLSLSLLVEIKRQDVEKGLPPPLQHGPARVLELGAGGDGTRPEKRARGRVRKRGAGSPYVFVWFPGPIEKSGDAAPSVGKAHFPRPPSLVFTPPSSFQASASSPPSSRPSTSSSASPRGPRRSPSSSGLAAPTSSS